MTPRAHLVAAGRCPDCLGKVKPGLRSCAVCLEKRARRHASRREARKARGLCAVCQEPAEGGFTACGPCRAVQAERRAHQRAHQRTKEICGE